MLTIHTTGNWSRGNVRASIVPSSRRVDPLVEAFIESSWRQGQERLGVKLFDGTMCRMERWRATSQTLELSLSRTSYRVFFGTNLSDQPIAEHFGREVLANPVGISSALLTRDGWLLYGRRNNSVAYYPNRVHPFAGSLEEKDLADVFGAVERELNEELHLAPADIESIRCIGIVEDEAIKQPELIFHTRVHLTRQQIESQVDADEHGGSVAIESSAAGVEQALDNSQEFTPVGIATLLLFGNDVFGAEWLQLAPASLPVSVSQAYPPSR